MSLQINSAQLNLPHYRSIEDPTAHMKRLEGVFGCFQGWILSLFDLAVRIKDERQNQYFYVRTRDIARELCAIPGAPIWKTIDPSADKIRRLVLENLHPVIGENATLEKVARFFHEFRSQQFIQKLSHCKDDLEVSAKTIERLENFKNRHLTVLTYDECTMMNLLKPGDILFKKPEAEKKNKVVFWQKLLAPFTPGKKERQGYQFSHLMIYLGNGKMAESNIVPNTSGVRIFDIRNDEAFAFKPFSPKEYLVTRCKDPKIAEEAAKIAAGIAKDDSIDDPNVKALKYDKFMAMQSVFHTPCFGLFGRFRYLKQYIDDHEHRAPMDFMKVKNFFCSYFVAYCYQTAESRIVIPKILSNNDVPAPGCSPVDTAVRRGLWARVRRWQFWKQMSDNIKFSFDAKRISPHEMRNFVVSKPDLFQDLYLFKAPA